jgi:hypothetical protein
LDVISEQLGNRRRVAIVAAEAFAICLAALLLWSALAKADSPRTAEKLVRSVIPWVSARALVSALCLAEIGLAVLLITGRARRPVFLTAGAFVCGLTGVFALARALGYSGGCGCFGRATATQWHELLLRNGGLVISCVVGFALTPARSSWGRRGKLEAQSC